MASGKSTAAKYLQAQGADLIDADVLGHHAYEPGTQAFRQVVDTFGEDIVAEDDRIDRRILGSKVFGNSDELKKLTDIVWPEIRRLAELEINSFEALNAEAIVVLEAAVLIEAGWQDIGAKYGKEIWVVSVDREIAISRSIARDGFERDAVESRLNSQLSNAERIAHATVVIENNTTPEAMKVLLDEQWRRITSAEKSNPKRNDL